MEDIKKLAKAIAKNDIDDNAVCSDFDEFAKLHADKHLDNAEDVWNEYCAAVENPDSLDEELEEEPLTEAVIYTVGDKKFWSLSDALDAAVSSNGKILTWKAKDGEPSERMYPGEDTDDMAELTDKVDNIEEALDEKDDLEKFADEVRGALKEFGNDIAKVEPNDYYDSVLIQTDLERDDKEQLKKIISKLDSLYGEDCCFVKCNTLDNTYDLLVDNPFVDINEGFDAEADQMNELDELDAQIKSLEKELQGFKLKNSYDKWSSKNYLKHADPEQYKILNDKYESLKQELEDLRDLYSEYRTSYMKVEDDDRSPYELDFQQRVTTDSTKEAELAEQEKELKSRIAAIEKDMGDLAAKTYDKAKSDFNYDSKKSGLADLQISRQTKSDELINKLNLKDLIECIDWIVDDQFGQYTDGKATDIKYVGKTPDGPVISLKYMFDPDERHLDADEYDIEDTITDDLDFVNKNLNDQLKEDGLDYEVQLAFDDVQDDSDLDPISFTLKATIGYH